MSMRFHKKKILILSLGPVFPNAVHGGSQKVLREVSLELGEGGNLVTILCTRRSDLPQSFELSPNVMVKPVLPFRHVFPQPFRTNPLNLASAINHVQKEKRNADLIYAHDAGVNFLQCYEDLPTVLSARDVVYPETLVGVMNFYGDKLIVNSTYSQEVLAAALALCHPKAVGRIVTIPNGIDTVHFRPRDRDHARKEFNFTRDDFIILSPHRPEEGKGHGNAIRVAALLSEEMPRDRRLQIVVPSYIDLSVSEEKRPFYEDLQGQASDLGVDANLRFINWTDYSSMPLLYSMADVTVSLGNYIESFPNVSVESLACGTPSISVNVGAHRSVIPQELEHRIDYGDWESAALACLVLCTSRRRPSAAERLFVEQNHSFMRMKNSYVDVICNTSKAARFDYEAKTLDNEAKTLAPWCYVASNGRIYHDYLETFYSNQDVVELISRSRGPWSREAFPGHLRTEYDHLVEGRFFIPEMPHEQ